jgi:hypothetical protein
VGEWAPGTAAYAGDADTSDERFFRRCLGLVLPRWHIHLNCGSVKSKRGDLTPQQAKVLAELMKDLKDG